MKCSRCKQKCSIHWGGICDACKLHDVMQENKELREVIKKAKDIAYMNFSACSECNSIDDILATVDID